MGVAKRNFTFAVGAIISPPLPISIRNIKITFSFKSNLCKVTMLEEKKIAIANIIINIPSRPENVLCALR